MTWSDTPHASETTKEFRRSSRCPLQVAKYMMSASPPKETDVEAAAAQSPGNSEHMERDPQDPQAQGLAYEFEVKEQDRWLPIANGWSPMHPPCLRLICAYLVLRNCTRDE